MDCLCVQVVERVAALWGMRNIHDSFRMCCEAVVLAGENQYKTENHGMQVWRCLQISVSI